MILDRLFGNRDDRAALRPLYAAIVARARAVHWYRDGGVPDTIDGRFDMVALILALVLIRIEGEPERRADATKLTELFIDDMDGQLRERGIGDLVVGKHVGRMLGAVGGRIDAYRDGLRMGGLEDALARNLFRGEPVDRQALAHVSAAVRGFDSALAAATTDDVMAGRLP